MINFTYPENIALFLNHHLDGSSNAFDCNFEINTLINRPNKAVAKKEYLNPIKLDKNPIKGGPVKNPK